MVSRNLSETDIELLKALLTSAMMRRKQLCPWTLTTREVESLYLSPEVRRHGDALDKSMPGMLYKNTALALAIPADTKTVTVYIRIRGQNTTPLWIPQRSADIYVLDYDTEARKKFMHWVAQAVRVYTESSIVCGRVSALLGDCTTQNQVAKACPELLYYAQACTVRPVDNKYGRAGWVDSRTKQARQKLKVLSEEIPRTTDSRARLKSPQVAEDGRVLGVLLRKFIPQALLLPDHNGLGSDDPFHNTWVAIANTR